MSRRRAVITGIGPITCIGKGVDAFWNGIRAEKAASVAISTFRYRARSTRIAAAKFPIGIRKNFFRRIV